MSLREQSVDFLKSLSDEERAEYDSLQRSFQEGPPGAVVANASVMAHFIQRVKQRQADNADLVRSAIADAERMKRRNRR